MIELEDLSIFIKEATTLETIKTLETILMKMDGIEKASVDIDDGEVKITYHETQVNHEKIKNWIQRHGLSVLN